MTVPVEDGVSRRRSAGRAQTAADLHTLVDRVHVPGPYVLAGHSFGGLYILAFAAHYPRRGGWHGVAGLHCARRLRSGSLDRPRVLRPAGSLLSAAAHLGVARLVGQVCYGSLPPRSRDEARASAATARHVKSFLDELSASPKAMR
jgi:pimeloyl-ACP methyl ester carboxylesterase